MENFLGDLHFQAGLENYEGNIESMPNGHRGFVTAWSVQTRGQTHVIDSNVTISSLRGGTFKVEIIRWEDITYAIFDPDHKYEFSEASPVGDKYEVIVVEYAPYRGPLHSMPDITSTWVGRGAIWHVKDRYYISPNHMSSSNRSASTAIEIKQRDGTFYVDLGEMSLTEELESSARNVELLELHRIK